MSTNMWDVRFAEPELAYGDQPNDFLREAAANLEPGRALCLAEGQGRNAVWLAERGFATTAVDLSAVGLRRARNLAASRGVNIETVVADLSTWQAEPSSFDLVVAIFAHLPSPARAQMHQMAARALKPGGRLILEAYTPRQLAHNTGGPRDVAMLVEPEVLRAELDGLVVETLQEVEREIHEGAFHNGLSAVVQCVARRV